MTYSKPSGDYEALKAKYDIKYESQRETTYDNDKKYGEYKSDYRTEYRSGTDLGESKYRKDYASNEVEDPLIVYNRKGEIGSRDSLGYKSSSRGVDDYDEYRKKLKSSSEYEGRDRGESRYESKYETSNYRSNVSGDYDKYDTGYESKYRSRGNDKYDREDKEDRYERNYREEKEDRYSSTRQPR